MDLIVGTTSARASTSLSIKKAAEGLIRKGVVVSGGLLDRIEMAFRAYDPCFGCATHALPGRRPMEVTIHDAEGRPVRVLRRRD